MTICSGSRPAATLHNGSLANEELSLRTKRIASLITATTLSGVLFLGVGISIATASTPAGGPIQFYAPQSNDGIHGTIFITGAIGDFGKTLTIDKNGKPDANGNYVKITLQKGTFELNSTALNAKFKNLQPTVYKATCSAFGSGTAKVTLFDGTGLYQGISGTWNISASFGIFAPLFKSGKNKGQCDLSNNVQPINQYTLIGGKGIVSF